MVRAPLFVNDTGRSAGVHANARHGMSSDRAPRRTHAPCMAASSGTHRRYALTPHETRRVAVEAGCDPRTVRRYLDGEPVVSTCSDRIRRALDALGLPSARP